MRLPKPIQKENGKWLVQVMQNGRRISKTFDTEQEALYWAAGIKTQQQEISRAPHNLTLAQAIDRYIESKDAVLSPSTISGYKKIKDNSFPELMGVRLADLRKEAVQRAVNRMAKEKSPKTVRNAYGLITAVVGEYCPDLDLRKITLPQKERTDIVVPSEQDIVAIAEAVRGKSVELPVLLAMWLGLRMSEIRGLTWDSIKGNTIHIKQAKVDEGIKTTKTYNSNRTLPLPPYLKQLIEAQPRKSEYIVPDSRRAIYSRFAYWTEKAGIQHYRFHDLRHVNASVMLALNIPDKYAMQRMGHSSNNMLKTVYQHTMTEKEQEYGRSVDDYFSNLLTPK